MLIAAEGSGQAKEGILATLERHIISLYARPYLPSGTAERTLLLLQQLFEVGLLHTLLL